MNFLDMLSGMFNKQPVEMAPAPSIVKAGEDEEIFVQTDVPAMGTPSSPMTHGPNGMFGDIYNKGDMPQPETQPAHPMAGVPATIAQKISAGLPQSAILDGNVTVPDIAPMEEPVIPPEMNETVDDTARALAVPSVEEGEVPPIRHHALEDLKKWRATIPDDHKDAALADQRIAEMEEEVELFYKDRKGASLIGSENQGNLTDEERVAVDEALRTIPDESTLDTDKPMAVNGAPAKPTVGPKGATVTKADIETVKAEDPSGWEKAMSWVQKTFGINGQDLARFALLYAGSRVAGYGHGGSMSWAFEVAGQDLLDRRKISASIADSGKYTPASIEEYRKTGNVSVLKPLSKSGNYKIDETNPDYKEGTDEPVYSVTDDAGNKFYVDRQGNRYRGKVWDGKSKDTQDKVRESVVGSNKSIITDITKVRTKDEDPWYTGSPEADAQIAHDLFADYAAANGVPVDSAAVADVMRGAAIAAREQYKGRKGADVNSLQPFIEQQIIYRASDEPWAGALRKEDGSMLDAEEFGRLQGTVMSVVSQLPDYEKHVAKSGSAAVLSAVMKELHKDWDALSPDQKKNYRGNFYNYLQQQTLNPFD